MLKNIPATNPYRAEYPVLFLYMQYINGIKAIHARKKILNFWKDNASNNPDIIENIKYLNLYSSTINLAIIFFIILLYYFPIKKGRRFSSSAFFTVAINLLCTL